MTSCRPMGLLFRKCERRAGVDLVDLGVRDQVPDRDRPWLLWVWVYMLAPRPDGLSSTEEAEVLFALEDHMIAKIGRALDAKLVGRITTQGRREFYVYADRPLAGELPLSDALKNFPEYRFDWGTKKDTEWQQYLTVLYPSEEELQKIKNRRVLEVLEERGNDSEQPREIRHWFYFKTVEDRDALIRDVRSLGFSIVSSSENTDYANPFGVHVARADRSDQESIDSVTIELFKLAKCHQGEYDGWETQVVKRVN